MAQAFENTKGDLAEQMLAALDAAQSVGGDIRGRQSAALIVVTGKPTGQAWKDRLFDLRVDDSPEPLRDLRRLVTLQRAYSHMNAGDLAVEKKDNEGALREYGAAEKLVPDNAEMIYWHAVALVNMGSMIVKLWLLSCALLLLCSCSGRNRNPVGENQNTSEVTSANEGLGEKMDIKLTSTAFRDGGMIPTKYTCDGANVSPPLEWSGAPQATKSLALICDDPDAPGKTWVHWVLFDLPAGRTSLPENVPPQETIAGGGKQGTTDFKKIGYGGPCPPSGTHRYFFKICALDTELNLDSRVTKDQLLQAMKDHILTQGELIGRYKR